MVHAVDSLMQVVLDLAWGGRSTQRPTMLPHNTTPKSILPSVSATEHPGIPGCVARQPATSLQQGLPNEAQHGTLYKIKSRIVVAGYLTRLPLDTSDSK